MSFTLTLYWFSRHFYPKFTRIVQSSVINSSHEFDIGSLMWIASGVWHGQSLNDWRLDMLTWSFEIIWLTNHCFWSRKPAYMSLQDSYKIKYIQTGLIALILQITGKSDRRNWMIEWYGQVKQCISRRGGVPTLNHEAPRWLGDVT